LRINHFVCCCARSTSTILLSAKITKMTALRIFEHSSKLVFFTIFCLQPIIATSYKLSTPSKIRFAHVYSQSSINVSQLPGSCYNFLNLYCYFTFTCNLHPVEKYNLFLCL